MVTFTIDGREVTAPAEHDARRRRAKYGDVEIPVFCYEPKLGPPVGACRMCLVEIEGIPKLQTGCSTPVKDGMVVHTNTPRVKEAQEAVARVPAHQPPARLPGLRQGRRVPAAGHLLRLGRRHRAASSSPSATSRSRSRSRPLIAIDRERCILCYRCVRFSQEISEDYQLILQERGAGTVRRDLRRPPLRRAVQRQHHRAVPGRRADLAPLPLPRAPVGHRAVRLGLHALPGAVQRQLHRPRRARPARAARDNDGRRRRLAVRQGPLRLPGDPRRRAHHRSRCCATAASCAPSPGSARSRRPRPACRAPGAASARWSAARRRTRRAGCSSA